MITDFEVKAVMQIDQEPGKPVRLLDVRMNLILPEHLDRDQYLKADGLPTNYGQHTITTVLVQALLANVRYGKVSGQMEETEHMRYILKELERGFSAAVKTEPGEFKIPTQLIATGPAYYEWLHEIALLGYKEDIVLRQSSKRLMENAYESGLSAADALLLYKKSIEGTDGKN